MQETNPNGACIKLLARYQELDLPKKQAIENTIQVLGVTPEVLLEIMTNHQAGQKKIKSVQREDIAIGG